MREIKFRGLGADGQWWYGQPTPLGERRINLAAFFANLHAGGIDPRTVGEYTGRKDRNGQEIYEGDIVKALNGSLFEIRWANGLVAFTTVNLCDEAWDEMMATGWHLAEVVGNVYENPELVEGCHANP